MFKSIFVNLPVSDLEQATKFYEALGGAVNPQFSDDRSACIVLSETIFVMLLSHGKYASFTSRPIGDAHKVSHALLCVSVDAKEEVGTIVERAAAAGGKADPNPHQDLGFMFSRSIEDPDGNVWEILWMSQTQ